MNCKICTFFQPEPRFFIVLLFQICAYTADRTAGDGLGALGMILGEGAKNASGSLDAGMKDLSSLFDGFSGGSTSSKKKKSERKSSGMAEKTVEAVGDTAKSAVDIVDKTAKGTIDAVGDTTKKAAEGVKNLFKGFDK